MRVRNAMTRQVERTWPDATLQQAAQQMREASIGFLPVEEEGRLVGVVTDRDITVRGTARGLDPRTARVREAMTPQVVACREDQAVADASTLMEERAVRRLVVLDAGERLVGVLSLDDLAVLPGGELQAGAVLDSLAAPREPRD